MTRSIVLGGLAISALLIAVPLGAASAADMPVKAPAPPPPPAFNWNGFYIGAYAGAAWMYQANTTDICTPALLGACTAAGVGINFAPAASYDMKPSFIGGGTIGYNWQPTPFTLIGLENDFGYLHLKGSTTINPPPGGAFLGDGLNDAVATTKLGNWYDAYTARIGAVDGHAMFYLKGGGVSLRETTGVVQTDPPIAININTTTTKTLTGWAAGGGIEYALDMHWSFKAEYLVLGVANNDTTCGPGQVLVGGGSIRANFPAVVNFTACSTTHIPDVQTITLGLNYRFH
jgi:outer membrane immunogenic protein